MRAAAHSQQQAALLCRATAKFSQLVSTSHETITVLQASRLTAGFQILTASTSHTNARLTLWTMTCQSR